MLQLLHLLPHGIGHVEGVGAGELVDAEAHGRVAVEACTIGCSSGRPARCGPRRGGGRRWPMAGPVRGPRSRRCLPPMTRQLHCMPPPVVEPFVDGLPACLPVAALPVAAPPVVPPPPVEPPPPVVAAAARGCAAARRSPPPVAPPVVVPVLMVAAVAAARCGWRSPSSRRWSWWDRRSRCLPGCQASPPCEGVGRGPEPPGSVGRNCPAAAPATVLGDGGGALMADLDDDVAELLRRRSAGPAC